jgi:hypothetical protein
MDDFKTCFFLRRDANATAIAREKKQKQILRFAAE